MTIPPELRAKRAADARALRVSYVWVRQRGPSLDAVLARITFGATVIGVAALVAFAFVDLTT